MSRRETHADRAVRILEVTSREVLRYLERRLGTDDAPDALSETMTIIWRRSSSIPSTDEEARLWVFGVARNVVLNFSRGRRRQSLLAERLRGTGQVSGGGIAIGMAPPDGGSRQDIIIDPTSGLVIGEQTVTLQDLPGTPAGTVESWTSVQTSVVDSAP